MLVKTDTGREYSNQPFTWPVHEKMLCEFQSLRNAEPVSPAFAISQSGPYKPSSRQGQEIDPIWPLHLTQG